MSKEKVERNKKIIAYYRKGKTIRAIAGLFHITHPRVISIIEKYVKKRR